MVDTMTSSDEERVGRCSARAAAALLGVPGDRAAGCAECYHAFQFQLRPLLRRIHGDTRHRGKVPARDGEGAVRSRQIQRLHDELQRAVEREEFEHAAAIRDEIKRLEPSRRPAAGEDAMTKPSRGPTTFDELVAGTSPWLSGDGPHADLVLSTRIRLARNLDQVPFTHRARDEQLQGVLASAGGAAQQSSSFAGALVLPMEQLSAVERQVLVERHLVSHELGDGARPRGIVVAPGERLSLMINEEDHLRLQSMAPGIQLADAWSAADAADDELGRSLDFAFSEEIGYPDRMPDERGHRVAGIGAHPLAGARTARRDPEGAEGRHAGGASACAGSTASTAR
jgi:hypothetical protein